MEQKGDLIKPKIPFGFAILLVLAAAGGLLPGSGQAGATAGPIKAGDLVLLNGRVYDGRGDPPNPNGLVAVRGERIVAVGARGDFDLPEGAEVIDAGGGFIMPGVIDTHVHLFESVFAGFDVLTPWLQAGVTTIRDLGNCLICVPLVRNAISNVADDPPRVLLSGPSITSPGGPLSDNPTLGLVVSDEEEARAAVADHLDNQGADLIKLYNPEMPLEMSRAIVEEAHARGKRVASHPDGLVAAIAAGVDDVTHPPFEAVTDEVLQQAADQGIEMNSTLFGFPNSVLGRYRDVGGVVAMGTDTPPNSRPGCQLPVYEMQDMIASGLSAKDALVASTKNAAIVSGLGSDLGTLELGKLADIIVVDGDPLTDISAMENVSLVMKGGRLVDLTPRHSNDEFAFAEPISALPFDGTTSFYCADREEGEPETSCAFAEASRTVWFNFVPEVDGLVNVDLNRTALGLFPSAAFAVGVFTGGDLASLTELHCGFGATSFPTEEATTYYLQVHALVDFTSVLSTGALHLGLVGDPSCDGAVSSIDAALVLQFDAGLLNALACQGEADVTRDGSVNSIDAALILQLDAGLIDSLPV